MCAHSSRENVRVANRIALSCIVATVAFWAYTQTLLPGVDPGDTGGFQAAVLWPEVSARQAYPLYYGLARPFVAASAPDNPARALNLFSAVCAAAAVGLLVFLCASVTRSLAGGAVAGGLLAFSYTFWTQAVIAEVYALHLALIGLCLVTLYAYAAKPTTARLAIFFGVYALAFGNHLTMILLLVPCAIFLLHATPTPRDLFTPSVVAIALIAVAVGAMQYSPNFLSVWRSFDAPASWTERVAAFWFDTTKQDWRNSMVLGIEANQASDRLAMWWFDARQQFGVAGLALAATGVIGIWRMSRRWAVAAVTAYALTTLFALTYNVGDTHVFFLPGHFLTAFSAGAAVAWLSRLWGEPQHPPEAGPADRGRGPRRARLRGGVPWSARLGLGFRRMAAATGIAAAFIYVGWRGWSTWPAVDRHADRRGEQLIALLTLGIGERDALFVSQMNWQLENVLLYTGRYLRPDLAWTRLGDVMAHWPFLVEDNQRIGRDVVVNAQAAADIVGAYGPRYPLIEDAALPVPSLVEAAAEVPRGMPYVLSVLTPPREDRLDPKALAAALDTLTAGKVTSRTGLAFEVFAGVAGEGPQIHRSSNRPFTEQFHVLEEPFTVRMDSWLPSDTFRRAGFGHVLRGRDQVMTLERGINLVWLGRTGLPSPPHYSASLFAAQPRYRLLAAPRLARGRAQGSGLRPKRPQG
jgi:hypothetical protein